MVNKVYEHDTEVNPVINYCQPSMSIDLQKFVKLWKNILDNNAKTIL